MKKNRTMRVAVLLMALTLMTSCFVGNTFAKYVTQESASDSARVAKWGVLFDIEGGPLFDTIYDKDDSGNIIATGATVKSSTTDNLVAPGTKGKLVTFRVMGQPEVSYEVTFSIDDTSATTVFTQNQIVLTYDATTNAPTVTPTEIKTQVGQKTGYYPIYYTYTLGSKTFTETNDFAQMIADINSYKFMYDVEDGMYYEVTYDDANKKFSETYETDGSFDKPTVTINWEWKFDTNNDLADTTLGNIAADVADTNVDLYTTVAGIDGTNYELDINMALTATATQID